MFYLIAASVLVFAVMAGFNQTLQPQNFTILDPAVPEDLDGYKIVQLSDFHCVPVPGLLEEIDRIQPDLVVCTGDIFDGVQSPDTAFTLLKTLGEKYETYYVTGNHEKYLDTWPVWKEKVKELAGVRLLEDETVKIPAGRTFLEVAGIDDPGMERKMKKQDLESLFAGKFEKLGKPDSYRILLYHRASLLELIPESTANLVLAGHLHGGQWRFFGIGVCGPGDFTRVILFPRHAAGFYRNGRQKWIVSRGLGDKMKIPRIFNRPHLPVITLKHLDDLQ